MLVKDLIAVVDIWRVIVDDPGTTLIALTLEPLSASFAGTHCEAIVGEPGGQKVTVLGDRLRGVLSLFNPEAELVLEYRAEKGRLAIKTKGRVAELAVVVEGAGASLGLQEGSTGIEAPRQQVVPAAELAKALAFLQTCVATSAGQPIVTGVKFAHDKAGGLILAATDREAHTGIVRVPGEKPTRRITEEVVLPVKEIREFLAYLIGMGEETVQIDLTPTKAVLAGVGAVMRIAGLTAATPFPNLQALRPAKQFDHTVQIEPQLLHKATQASVLLDSDRVVRLAIKRGRAALIVQGDETGSFRSLLPGGAEVPDSVAEADLLFDAHWLEPLEHLGDTATLYYQSPQHPVLFVGENGYRLWLALVMPA